MVPSSSDAVNRAEFKAPSTPGGPTQLSWPRRWKWFLLLAGSASPIAVLAAYGGVSGDGLALGALFPVTLACGAFFGAWTDTVRDGFAAGVFAGWTGFVLGAFVGIVIQAAAEPTTGWEGEVIAVLAGLLLSAFVGLLYAFIGGFGGGAMALAKVRLARWRPASPPAS